MAENTSLEVGPKSIAIGTAATAWGLIHLLPLTIALVAIIAMVLLHDEILAVLIVFAAALLVLSSFFKKLIEGEYSE